MIPYDKRSGKIWYNNELPKSATEKPTTKTFEMAISAMRKLREKHIQHEELSIRNIEKEYTEQKQWYLTTHLERKQLKEQEQTEYMKIREIEDQEDWSMAARVPKISQMATRGCPRGGSKNQVQKRP